VLGAFLTSREPSPALAPVQSCEHTSSEFHCVKYLKNYDGDTITFHIPGVHALLGDNISVRVQGLDTPEKRTKNACEKQAAGVVTDLVAKQLKAAERIDLVDVKRGKYFRIVARVLVDGRDLGEAIMKTGLAYSYDGGTKSKINWCRRLERGVATSN